MQHVKTILAALAACLFLSNCQSHETSENPLPARWIFMDKNTTLYAGDWTGDKHCIKAMNGAPVIIEAVKAEGKEDTPYIYCTLNDMPFVGPMKEDDCIMFRIPARSLEKGSHVEIDAAIVSKPGAPKYFIIEYLEDGIWKSVEDDLMPIPENPELKYSFQCTGLADGEPHEYTSIYQTIALSSKVKGRELKIRFRAVGDRKCAEGMQDTHEGFVGFADFGYTGAYIADFGSRIPSDTTDILCIGNSFTFFSNAPSMMKEIAWSQGHYFNVKASLKGGQTLGQHSGRILTRHLAEKGGYDYAIFQDQSQNPARYASDPIRHAHVAEGYMDLCSLVLPHSPGCQVIMEQTWAYPAFGHGGFDDFRNFTQLLEDGAEMMAAQNGGMVSPIGNAYEIIWNDNRDDIRLFDSDAKHQSHYGSYLKACVNYLMITGEPFSDSVSDCSLEPQKAAMLRSVAERVVLGTASGH